jgi:pre-mRNA branch site protein p14
MSSIVPAAVDSVLLPLLSLPEQYTRKLAPDVSRILYVKSLPFSITTAELFNLFGRYGPIRQVRLGSNNQTRGRAFVVYEDIFDAKSAAENLNGFNLQNRYLVVDYYTQSKKKTHIKPFANANTTGNKAEEAVDLAQKPLKERKRKLDTSELNVKSES